MLLVFIGFKSGVLLSGDKSLLLENALPLGFSFIMFHGIALLLDRKNKIIESPLSFFDYITSATFFSTFLIGPFHKFQTFSTGIKNSYNMNRTLHGYCLITLGIFKFAFSGLLLKNMLITIPMIKDSMALQIQHPINIILVMSLYLYTNFSGFSDMAVGFGKLLGIDIPLNFKFPFLATSMADYWRHWHITLGAWFREYVFLPLNYKLNVLFPRISSDLKVKLSIFITFFLIGMWHEFSAKIFLYSLLNASLVAFVFIKKRPTRGIAWFITFVSAMLINALFLSDSINTFLDLLDRSYQSFSDFFIITNIKVLIFIFFMSAFFYYCEKKIDSFSDYALNFNSKNIFYLFVLSTFLLIGGLSLGLSGVNTVYVGY